MKKRYPLLLVLCFFCSVNLLRATNYYVSPGGSDATGNGTIGNPYKSLDKACQYVAAGDTIFMRGGIYSGSIQSINATSNGTSSAPIVIKNYPGEEPIIDGTGLNISSTTSLLMIAKWQVAHMEYFVVEGITVRNSAGRGIGFYRTTHLTIRNCKVYNTWERGIGGFGYHTTIEGNEVFHCGLMNENGSMGSSGWPIMIRLTTDYENGDRSEHATIRNNYVYESWGEGIAPGEKSYNIVIENNTIRDVFSVGIYCEKANYVTIRNNYIYSTDPAYYRNGRPATGVLLANESPMSGYPTVSHITIYNNLMAKCGKGVSFWFDASNTSTANTYDNITVAYNTIVETTYRAIAFDDVPAGYTQPSACILQNNIIENGSHSNYIDDISAWTVSHNCWVNGVPSFDQSSGSFQGQPHFIHPVVNGGVDGYRLSGPSECAGRGTPVSGITTDYWGKTRGSNQSVGLHEPSYYFVDGGVATSGNGRSWATAWKTIAEAYNYSLQPGDWVWIKNGTYASGLYPNHSGAEIVSLKTGVEISNNKIIFPAGTDLSDVNIATYPGQYFVYVYRSWKSNNGVYPITEVNVAERYVKVANASLLDETGVAGDARFLSASIGRPVVYKNGAVDPENDRVVLDVSSTNINTVAYIQNKNYLMVDGIDLTGSKNYGGWHMLSSSHNVVMNSRVYNMGTVSQANAPGILIEGNTSTGEAKYNIILNNVIYNTPHEGVYVGKGGGTANQNKANYNHVIGNRIYTQGSAGNAKMENAIDFKEYNVGNVAERNVIGPYKLSTTWNGAIDIVGYATNILVYGNVFQNVIRGDDNGEWDYYYVIGVNNNASHNYIFNNIIYNDNPSSGPFYGISIKSTNLTNSYIAHNTIYNLPYGLLLDNSAGNSTTIANNIIQCNTSITNWSNDNLTLRNNLYLTTPGSYSSEPGRQIGNARFLAPQNGDFRVSFTSLAVNNGYNGLPNMGFDFNLTARSSTPTIGAYELDAIATNAWTGASSTSWGTTGNWSATVVPDQNAGVLIPANCSNYPVITNPASNPVIVSHLTIEEGASLTLSHEGCLSVSGTLSNQAGATNLVLQSNSSGTGSLIHNSSGVNATVERYVAGDWSAWNAGWHFISSPVASQAISAFETTGAGNDYDFYGWRESDKTWLNYKAGDFSTWNGSTNFVVGRGYMISYEANQTKSFSGNLNVSDVSWSGLSYNPSQGNGWHLLGNPFASAIQWNKTGGSWSLSNVAGTAKIWNSGSKSYSDIITDGIIPSAQGFLVQVSNSTNGLTIPASARTHSSTAWYKSTTPRILLSASPADGSSKQESQIRIEAEATNGYDFYHDSRFLEGYAPKFYSITGGEMLSTNAMPQVQNGTSIPFGFVKNQHSNFVIRLEESIPGETIFLKDLKLNLTHNLSQQPEYLFSAAEGDDPNRFLLVFGTVGLDEKPQAQATLQAAMHNGQLWVNNPSANSLLRIHDLSGRLLQQMRLTEAGLQQLSTHLKAGAYILHVQGSKQTLSAKVINR
ncbi:MAG: right-handed parallel beta-helix repeat-containing protein [Bacteroidetes bacterium]|nr:right-handed parallel beta-helix repeat-containing protein [Bacteroidota bacterium]